MEKLLFLDFNSKYYTININDIKYLKLDKYWLTIDIVFNNNEKITEKLKPEVFDNTLQNIKNNIK